MMQCEMTPDERVEVRLNGFGDDEWFAATVTGKARKQHVTLDEHPFGGAPFTYEADETSIAEWRRLPDQEIPSGLDHIYEITRVPANWNGEDDPETVDELPAPPRNSIPAADRQLLGLAARALGAVRVEDVDGEQWVNLHFEDGSTMFGWNPLRHSDDTFALQVDLHMTVRADAQEQRTVAAWGDADRCTEYWNQHPDARTATRRAVTCAAAEIGKQRA